MENLEWDTTHHENTGKWRLLEPNLKPHRCGKSGYQGGKLIMANHLTHCGLCPWGYGWFQHYEKERHMLTFHKNGERVISHKLYDGYRYA
ncbi:MAG: hypothetical protein ACE5H1_02775 [Thermodesulfobacteriota bacterium]